MYTPCRACVLHSRAAPMPPRTLHGVGNESDGAPGKAEGFVGERRSRKVSELSPFRRKRGIRRRRRRCRGGCPHPPPHQCRPRKLRMPQGGLSCPCGAIHLLVRHGINAMAHSLRCSSSPQCDRLRWVTLGAPVCSTASPLSGEAYKTHPKSLPHPGGKVARRAG